MTVPSSWVGVTLPTPTQQLTTHNSQPTTDNQKVNPPFHPTPKETPMTSQTLHPEPQPQTKSLKNLYTYVAALLLTLAACYLLVGPPV